VLSFKLDQTSEENLLNKKVFLHLHVSPSHHLFWLLLLKTGFYSSIENTLSRIMAWY